MYKGQTDLMRVTLLAGLADVLAKEVEVEEEV